MQWYSIIFIASLANLFVYSKPTILLRRWIGFKDEQFDDWSKIKKFFGELITCPMCSAFWIGAYTLDIQIMAIAAIVANAIEKWIILK